MENLDHSKKLFAFDLDGTLVHGSGDLRGIPAYLTRAVDRLKQNHEVIVATGRRFRTALPDIQMVKSSPFAVVHNGSVVANLQGQSLASWPMDLSDLQWALDWFVAHSVDALLVMDGYHHGTDFGFLRAQLERSLMLQRVRERSFQHHHIFETAEDIISSQGPRLLEIATLGKPDDIKRVIEILRPEVPASLRVLNVHRIGLEELAALEVLPCRVSKWTGVQWVAQKLGCKEIICVGDDDNDIEMLREATVGVAMAHAQESVKESADRVVDGPQGLLEFLETYEES